jgi:hypothetical protein
MAFFFFFDMEKWLFFIGNKMTPFFFFFKVDFFLLKRVF